MKTSNYPLKVCTPEGQRVHAFITQRTDGTNYIEVPCIEAVRKDNPKFASNGTIGFTYNRKDQLRTIRTVTKYLEDLFLKEMLGENNYTSKPSGTDPRGSENKINVGAISKGKGQGPSPLHGSRGRHKQSKGTGTGEHEPNLAKGSDRKSTGQD